RRFLDAEREAHQLDGILDGGDRLFELHLVPAVEGHGVIARIRNLGDEAPRYFEAAAHGGLPQAARATVKGLFALAGKVAALRAGVKHHLLALSVDAHAGIHDEIFTDALGHVHHRSLRAVHL